MSPPRLAAAANAPTTRPRMQRDYTIQGGITLVQPPHELDLHNDFAFLGLEYSIEQRTAVLRWRRREGTWVRPTLPASASITFQDVHELRILPRDPEMPFTEDDCVSDIGYWTDEEWASGVVLESPTQAPPPHWLTAIEFQSGAVIAVQAGAARATIEA